MAKVSEAFPSQFLRAADLQGRTIRAQIDSVRFEDVGSEQKLIVYFAGKDKGLVLNKTNASTVAMAFGDETDNWQGNMIELFPQAVAFQGQMVPAIRVRVPAEPAKNGAGRIAPNAANRPAIQPQYDERNPPPAGGAVRDPAGFALPSDDDIPF